MRISTANLTREGATGRRSSYMGLRLGEGTGSRRQLPDRREPPDLLRKHRARSPTDPSQRIAVETAPQDACVHGSVQVCCSTSFRALAKRFARHPPWTCLRSGTADAAVGGTRTRRTDGWLRTGGDGTDDRGHCTPFTQSASPSSTAGGNVRPLQMTPLPEQAGVHRAHHGGHRHAHLPARRRRAGSRRACSARRT